MRRRSLPQLAIPVPCHVDWNAMTAIDPAGRTRFCNSCERPVYDSKAMTLAELADLIARHEGRRLPCVRLHRRPDGTIVTRNCLAPFILAGRFLWLKVALGAVAFWAWALGRPVARSLSAYLAEREAISAAIDRPVVYGGMIVIVKPDPDVAPKTQSFPRVHQMPALGIRALLPEVQPAAPSLYLEADDAIRKRLEPDRPPPPDPRYP